MLTSISTIIFPAVASHPHFLSPVICLHLPVAKGGRAPAAQWQLAVPQQQQLQTSSAQELTGQTSREVTKVYAAVEVLTVNKLEIFIPDN